MVGLASLLIPVFAATVLDSMPSLAFGVPLLIAASFVFAATHHEDPDAVRRAMIQWFVWLGVILGVVLGIVLLIGIWV